MIDAGQVRKLDCIDCHNRPSHTFAFSAERAVDEAITAGGFDVKVPFIRREAVKVLKAAYPTKDAAMAGIQTGLEQYYRANHADAPADAVARAVATSKRLFERNVFPTMKVSWGSYANNVGHSDPGPSPFPGCYRCHDENHKAKSGKAISQDCSLCHTIE